MRHLRERGECFCGERAGSEGGCEGQPAESLGEGLSLDEMMTYSQHTLPTCLMQVIPQSEVEAHVTTVVIQDAAARPIQFSSPSKTFPSQLIEESRPN
jgi:hypothetical protein